jgi:uncharacterized membrane protein YphA (DoxX/SURF4 family)
MPAERKACSAAIRHSLYKKTEGIAGMKKLHVDLSNFWIQTVLGIIMLAHGLMKVKNMEGTLHHFLADYGLPAPMTFAVTAIEVIAGALLILGLYTQWAAAAVALVMIGAICTVTWSKGFFFGYEFNLALLAMAISIIANKRKAVNK